MNSRAYVLLLVVAPLCWGCEEERLVPDVDPSLAAPGDFEAVSPGSISMRRLTASQRERTLKDVFGDETLVPPIAEPEVSQGGLIAVGASSASFSPRGVGSVEEMSFTVAEQVFAEASARAHLVPCTPSAVRDDACAATTLDALGLRLWRRPLSAEERIELVDFAGLAAERLGDFYQGLEFGVARLLQSPHFLFRTEVGEADPLRPERRRYTGYELASRLSFFLWNTGPDAALLDAAASGTLHTRDGLMEQTDRLLASPRAREGLRHFFDDYLGLEKLGKLSKDPTIFEHYTSALRGDAREETLRLMEYLVFDLEADIREMLTTNISFINPNLAAIYGIPAPDTDGFAYVEQPADSQRVGILTHASFLALHAHAVSSSATLRGKAVRLILLCQDIPAPPVNVDTAIPEPSGDALTLRDRVAEHLQNASCAGCHRLTDPIGLSLENFDGLGRWRDQDNGADIDASGELDGTAFEDPMGLAHAVREHPNFVPCLVKTMGRYANGRIEEREERALLDTLEARFVGHEYQVLPLVRELIASPLFRHAGVPN